MNTYHIMNERNELWSIGKKQWGIKRDATIFSEFDASNLTLPDGGRWKIIV